MTDISATANLGIAQEVADRVRGSGTSFYAAMCLLPPDRRNAMFAIYAFCRDVDDIVDGDAPQEEKHRRLDVWRREVSKLYDGEPVENPIAKALASHVRAFGLKRQDFIDIIDGMEMDADREIVAPTWAELDLYCDRVASAVGRLSVRAFGAEGEASLKVAHHLGRALQLTNILRDLREDGERGRVYLPSEILTRHGVTSRDPNEILRHERLPDVCRDVAEVAKDHYTAARAAMQACSYSSMRPARLMSAAYRAILDRMTKQGWRDLSARISLPGWQKVWLLVRHGLF